MAQFPSAALESQAQQPQTKIMGPLDATAQALGIQQAQQGLQMGNVKLREGNMALSQQENALKDDQDIRAAAEQAKGDPDLIVTHLQSSNPRVAAVFSKQLADRRKVEAERIKDELDIVQRRIDMTGQIAHGINPTDPESVNRGRLQLEVIHGADSFKAFDLTNPAHLKQLQDDAQKHSEWLTAQQNAIKNAADAQKLILDQGKESREARESWQKALAEAFAGTQSQADHDNVTAAYRNLGAPKELFALYGTQWTPDVRKKAAAVLGRNQTEFERTLDDFNNNAELTKKYGTGPIAFDKYKQDQRVEAAREGRIQVSTPGDFNKTGPEFLSTIPAQWRKTVEKIANYDEDPTKVASMRGGMREQLIKWVNQVNSGYDETEFRNIAPTRKAFTTGTQGQQIVAINTAIGHIDQITRLGAALDNGQFVPGNALYNWARSTFGSDKVTNFDTLKDALAGEIASVLSKGQATVSGIAEAKDKVKAASSPAQLAGYVKTLLPLMGSKLNALTDEYQKGTFGHHPTFSALSEESKAILRKNGVDPDDILGNGAGPAPAKLNPFRPNPAR